MPEYHEPDIDPATLPITQGYLLKKGSGDRMFGRRTWLRRFFRIEGTSLAYYETDASVQAKGRVRLGADTQINPTGAEKQHKNQNVSFTFSI